MATNLQINEKLLAEAQALGGHKTKRETVDRALEEYVRARSRQGLIDLFGTIDYDEGWDYKAQRRYSTEKAMRKVRGQ